MLVRVQVTKVWVAAVAGTTADPRDRVEKYIQVPRNGFSEGKHTTSGRSGRGSNEGAKKEKANIVQVANTQELSL